jgi:SanA protein
MLFLIFPVVLAGLAIVFADWTIASQSEASLFQNVENIPKNKVALLLGTSKFLSTGKLNYYYKNRIDAAITLYRAGKIQFVVASGDNAYRNYNEPEQMKEDLIAGGIPEEKIFLDYAGFRTLDSVVRINKIFGQCSFTIISQKFHNQRAVYIAKKYGLQAVGFNAKDVNKHSGFKTQVRERFARVKVFIDLLTNKAPKFLGEQINID